MDGTSTADEAAEASARRMSNSIHRSFEHADGSHQHVAHGQADESAAFATIEQALPTDVKQAQQQQQQQQHARTPSASSTRSRRSSVGADGLAQQNEPVDASASPAGGAVDPEAAMPPQRRASGGGGGGEAMPCLDAEEGKRDLSGRRRLVDSHYAASPSPHSSAAAEGAMAVAGSTTAAPSPLEPWSPRSLWRIESDKLKQTLGATSSDQSNDLWTSSAGSSHAGPSSPKSSARPIKPLSKCRALTSPRPQSFAPSAEPSSACTVSSAAAPQRHGKAQHGRSRKFRWETVVIDRPSTGQPREDGSLNSVACDEEARRRKLPGTPSTASLPAERAGPLHPRPPPKYKRRKIDTAYDGGQEGSVAAMGQRDVAAPPRSPLRRSAAPSPPSVELLATTAEGAAAATQQSGAPDLFAMAAANPDPLATLAIPRPDSPILASPARTPTHTPSHILLAPQRQALAALRSSRRAPRLKRALSLPNLRAVHVTDLSRTSTHRHVLPPHLAQLIQSIYNLVDDARRVLHHDRSGASPRSAATITLPPLLPPITRSTLRELDMCEILKNPQLRHDLLFDANVQFRPNFDGERGRRKREACERYWFAIAREIDLGCTCTSFDANHAMLPCQCAGKAAVQSKDKKTSPTTNAPRLPALLQELRAICLSILPPASTYTAAARDTIFEATSLGSFTYARAELAVLNTQRSSLSSHHAMLSGCLDPTLITQQRDHGVLDPPALLRALADILATHCLPARRDLVDRMVELAARGRVADALRSCFEMLEVMKLDFANQQLRTTRAAIVENAHEFEQQWFRRSLEQGVIGLARTTEWYQAASSASAKGASSTVGQVFGHGVLELLFAPPSRPNSSSPATPLPLSASASTASSSWLNHTLAPAYPETFQFDAHRLWMLHNDVVDVVVVHMFLMLFGQLARQPPRSCSSATAASDLRARINVLVQQQMSSVKGEIWALLTETSGSSTTTGGLSKWDKLQDARWRQDEAKSILLHVASRADRLCDQAVRDVAGDVTQPSATTAAAPPSAATMTMLDSWLHKNMQLDSPLMGLCVKRLRGLFASAIAQEGLPASAPNSVGAITQGAGSRRRRSGELCHGDDDDGAEEEKEDEGVHFERVRKAPRREEPAQLSVKASSPVLQSLPPPTPRPSSSSSSWESQLEAAGLGAVSDEVCALVPRITQLTRLHLRTYMTLYEGLDRCALAA